jgi:hypothetical protein
MKTGQFVAATAGAGILGGIAGAWLFLTFFAESFRPKAEAHAPAPAAEFQFTAEEEAALRKLLRRVDELAGSVDAIRREKGGAGPARPAGAAPGPGQPDLTGAQILEANERNAISTLRNLCSAQAQVQASGKIDCDNDGIGEYGTFLEMTGTVGVRKGTDRGTPLGSDFSEKGTAMTPAVLASSLAGVDAEGRVLKNGYYFQIFLPDTQSPSTFVHETAGPSLAGGTGRVWVDLSETTWCCYAWPAEKGKTGNRAFFVNQAGDVLQSANDGGHHKDGTPFDPVSAFKAAGITGQLAIGTAGRDGDVWKVTN